jgi:hypothetical protein
MLSYRVLSAAGDSLHMPIMGSRDRCSVLVGEVVSHCIYVQNTLYIIASNNDTLLLPQGITNLWFGSQLKLPSHTILLEILAKHRE